MIGETTFQGESTCPRCGKRFSCGMRAGQGPCWCAAYPARLPVPDAGGACCCPDCLRQMLAQPQNDRRGEGMA